MKKNRRDGETHGARPNLEDRRDLELRPDLEVRANLEAFETLENLEAREEQTELSRIAAVLASASLFSTFEWHELDYLAGKSELLAFEGGQGIFEAGDPGDRLYIVASGSVVILSSEDGSVLAEFVEGDSFGELELLTGAKRNASSRAELPTTLLAFPAGGASLREALSERPEVAARILRLFLLVIAGRTRKSNALVKENSPWVRELRRQVYGDKLTGLLNKAYLEENLPKLLAASAAAVPAAAAPGSAIPFSTAPSAPAPLALIMMKPDNFKEINDRFGHEIGDAALVYIAAELDRAVGKEGTTLRYMGNELAVLYPGMDRARALEAARALQNRLSALDVSKLTGDPDLRLSISLGVALYPDHGTEADALIKAAAGLPLAARSRGGSLILFPEDAS